MGLLQKLFAPKVQKLEKRGDIDALLSLLAPENPRDDRLDAIQALARSKDERRFGALVQLLSDSDSKVADTALQNLRSFGQEAASDLVDALSSPAGDQVLELITSFGTDGVELLSLIHI